MHDVHDDVFGAEDKVGTWQNGWWCRVQWQPQCYEYSSIWRCVRRQLEACLVLTWCHKGWEQGKQHHEQGLWWGGCCIYIPWPLPWYYYSDWWRWLIWTSHDGSGQRSNKSLGSIIILWRSWRCIHGTGINGCWCPPNKILSGWHQHPFISIPCMQRQLLHRILMLPSLLLLLWPLLSCDVHINHLHQSE